MAEKSYKIQVISKADNADNNLVTVPLDALPTLASSSVRVRAALIALTANNLSYARLGTSLHWWDAYPVPSEAPAPYYNTSRYGIVPAWGYGEVIESNIDGIENGTLMWGYWPTGQLSVDLQLTPTTPQGHWLEVSEHREQLMPLYQRYTVPDPMLRLNGLTSEKLEELSWEAIFRPVWEASYLLNLAVFGSPPIHPLGMGSWTRTDADLSSAVVINLSASGKTARAFTDQLVNNRPAATGPLGLLAITSNANSNLLRPASFKTKTVSYDAAFDLATLSWINSLNPSRLVIPDFGGRGNSLQQLLQAFEVHFPATPVVVIGIGNEAKVYSPQEFDASTKMHAELSARVQMNTSGIKDTAMEQAGPARYFEEYSIAWQAFVERGGMDGMHLWLGSGMEGEKGVAEGWRKLCKGTVPSNVGMAFKL